MGVSSNKQLVSWLKYILILSILFVFIVESTNAANISIVDYNIIKVPSEKLYPFVTRPTVDIIANPSTISHGESSTITVTVKNSTSKTILDGKTEVTLTTSGGNLEQTSGTTYNGIFKTKFSSSNSGTFKLTVYAKNPAYTRSGNDSTMIEVQNNPPTAYFSPVPSSGKSPLTVTFDASGSTDIDGTITTYSWNFADGKTDTGKIVTHTYQKAGEFIPSLTVTDNLGVSNTYTYTQKITVVTPEAQTPTVQNNPPTAYFSPVPSSGKAPLTVTFDASGSTDIDGTITTYSWNFADGETDTGKIVLHTYQKAGEFIPSLTLTDNLGVSNTYTYTQKITVVTPEAQTPTVQNNPPTAYFSPVPSSGKAPLTVTFDASGSTDIDGTITTYSWNLENGKTGTGKIVTHTYQKAGEFIPSLTVTDNLGVSNTYTYAQKIIVDIPEETPPAPSPEVPWYSIILFVLILAILASIYIIRRNRKTESDEDLAKIEEWKKQGYDVSELDLKEKK